MNGNAFLIPASMRLELVLHRNPFIVLLPIEQPGNDYFPATKIHFNCLPLPP
jgi:hypothetical protein